MKSPKQISIAAALALIGAAAAAVAVSREPAIEKRIHDGLVEVRGNAGNVLEVSVLKLDQRFEEKDKLEYNVWGIPIYLGTSEAFLQVPVTYRFHILLDDTWKVSEAEGIVTIIAPALRPSLPPAPDMSEATVRSESGWARFNKKEVEERVKKTISPNLTERSFEYARSALVRDRARESVRNFLLNEFSFLSEVAKRKLIVVRFSDEPEKEDLG